MIPRPKVFYTNATSNRRRIKGPESLLKTFGIGWGTIEIAPDNVEMSVFGLANIIELSASGING